MADEDAASTHDSWKSQQSSDVDEPIDGEHCWSDFEASEVQNAIDRLLHIFQNKVMVGLIFVRIVWDLVCNPSYLWSGYYLISPRILFLYFAVATYAGEARLRRALKEQTVQIGVLVQGVIFLAWLAAGLLHATSMETLLMQHRMFLTVQSLTLLFVVCVFFFPFRLNVCVIGPTMVLFWLMFHRMVGFWNTGMMGFGFIGNCALPLYAAHILERIRWRQFQTSRQLDAERVILEETQEVLHSMLASQWDASCTCTADGRLVTCTPHLETLLGGGRALADSDLCATAATDADAARLLVFLHSVRSSVDGRPLTSQVTVRRLQLDSSSGFEGDAPFEVCLYGIKLPRGARFQSSVAERQGRTLFVGVKAVESSLLASASLRGELYSDSCDEGDIIWKNEDADDDDASDTSQSFDADMADDKAPCRETSAPSIRDSSAASNAETTITGRAFEIRKDEVNSKEFTSRLQTIATIGKSEHWLVRCADVQLLPDALLGVGSFGIVVEGRVHGTRVALKLPHLANDLYRGRALIVLVNELRVLRHVRHPNCVALHGACMDVQNSAMALVFEFVQGQALESIIGNEDSPPMPLVRLGIMLDVCCALRYLHGSSPHILHGDLKPSNILVEEWVRGLRGKVLDFGLSRLMTKNRRNLGGTVAYMAPEVMLGTRAAQGLSADVFSFGRLAHFIATGLKPYKNVKKNDIKAMVANGCVEPMEWSQEPLCKHCQVVCEQTSQFQPAKRPNMSTVHDSLQDCQWALLHEGVETHEGICKPVEWQDGLALVMSKFQKHEDEYQVSAIVDVIDPRLQIAHESEGWTTFFGNKPAASLSLSDVLRIMEPTGEWLSILQEYVNACVCVSDSQTLLVKVYVKDYSGQVWKADAMVSMFAAASVSSEIPTCVKVTLCRIRHRKKTSKSWNVADSGCSSRGGR